MAEELAKLVEAVSSTQSDLSLRLRTSSSLKLGLHHFYSILNYGVQAIDGENQSDFDDNAKKLGLQCWSISQIHSVCSLALLIATATRSLSVEHVEPEVVATLHESMEFALCCLEKSNISDDLSLQNLAVKLLEMGLLGQIDNESDSSQSCIASSLVDGLPPVSFREGGSLFEKHTQWNTVGEQPVDQLVMRLTSDMQVGNATQSPTDSIYTQDYNKLVSSTQHWAVLHLGCIRRLILFCTELVQLPEAFDVKLADLSFCRKLSLSLNILKLLRNLARSVPYVELDSELLQSIAAFADVFPGMFRPGIEFISSNIAFENYYDSAVLNILEEFLHLVQILSCGKRVFQNVRACVLASILGILDLSVWRYNKSVSNLKPPLVYFPRCVIYVVKLIGDVKNQGNEKHVVRDLGADLSLGISDPDGRGVCQVRSGSILLSKNYTVEELLEIIFPKSMQWVDNLIHLLCFLHNEGVKLQPKLEKSSSCAKSSSIPELENTNCHDDEALFGDLFSEGGRSVGSNDGYEQVPSVNPLTGSYEMIIQAAAEIFIFLKSCVFSPEWCAPVYEDACKKLGRDHIDSLLAMLGSQICYYDGFDGGPGVHEQRRIEQIQEICFEMLHGLLKHHALSDVLEEHLVLQILKVENGSFAYNDQTLVLVAQTLVCRVGSAGSHLRNKLYRQFVNFIVEKEKDVRSNCPILRELVISLPNVFHMEIILLAFHLSSESEKVALADLIFSHLKTFAASSQMLSSSQLSCWALIVSRLIVIFRHMLLNFRACPTSLLMDFRLKLNVARLTGCQNRQPNDSVISWSSIVVGKVMSSFIKEESLLGNLLNHLIDFESGPARLVSCDAADASPFGSWNDIYAVFSPLVGLWRGKKAATIEDLVLERYMFLLCLDMPAAGLSVNRLSSIWSANCDLDTSNIEHFVLFSHLLLGHYDLVNSHVDPVDMISRLLQHLCSVSMPDDILEFGWDWLRSGQWLSVVLSFLYTGFGSYCFKNSVPAVDFIWTENASDSEFVAFAEGFIALMLETNKVPVILKSLSALLTKYISVYQKAFLFIISENQSHAQNYSPLLLLKHTEFDECMTEEILVKNGLVHVGLESVYDLITKIDSVTTKRASHLLGVISSECMLHGFPTHPQASSGVLISSILSIRGIICLLDLLIKISGTRGGISLETGVLHEILDSVMSVKYDKVFKNLGEKCGDICRGCAGAEGPDYSSLFLMKQIEGFLSDINLSGSADHVKVEQLVVKAVDVMDALQRDLIGVNVLRFYLGAEDVSQQDVELYGSQRGDLLVLIDSLESCHSELVNAKVLNFFIDVLSGDLGPYVKQRIQKKFLGIDISCLSKWFEKRLLSFSTEDSANLTSAVTCAKGSLMSLRESTMSFILCLVSPDDPLSRELYSHLFNALLVSLETAFKVYDIHTAKSYFGFVTQLLRDEPSMRLLLQSSLSLMEKLAVEEHQLQGLKFLFSFFEVILTDSGSFASIPTKSTAKSLSGSSRGLGSISSRTGGSRKSTDTLILSANQDGSSVSFEYDAASIDEDEDDGTSDGEVASIDKDDEEDSSSERALASKVCTFTSSGSNFMEQHWYFCYTCDLTVSKGCCSVCAKVCHRGHRVVYSRSSRFFCDCGAGGVRGSTCQCLKPRKFTGSNVAPAKGPGSFQSLLPFTEDGDQLPDSDSDPDEDASIEADNSLRLSVPNDIQGAIPRLYEELDLEAQVLKICNLLLPSITRRRDGDLSRDKNLILGVEKVLSYGSDLLQLKKAYKSGSLDLKIKADYSNAKELRSLLASGALMKSLLSVSGRGRLAVGEGDKVAIFDVGQLIGQATVAPVTADKTNVKPLSKNVVRFEIVHLAFNPLAENYLAVAGYDDCQVFTVTPRGEVTDRLAIELALQGAYIRRVDWVPGSQVQLMVVTNRFVKIYDLSQDNISPLHYFTLADQMITDAVLSVASQGTVYLIVLSELGNLFKLQLSTEVNAGTKQLNEKVDISTRDVHVKGSSLYFSSTYKLLFVSYQDGSTFIGRLNSDATSLTEISAVYEDEQDDKRRPAGLHHWKELMPGSGLFVCFSSWRSNAALAVSLGAHEIFSQNIRHAVGSNSPVVGATAYKPLSKDKIHSLILHDDGSLQIFSHVQAAGDSGSNATSEKVKKLGPNILSNKAYAGVNPEFPLDFFEKTVCITADVKLGGDAVRNGDSEGAKQSLTSEDGFLESPSSSGFKITVSNSNPDIVMVGIRVHVGNTSANHIPSDITIFQRVIKLDEGMRCWYDIPFTVAESLLADEEFTVSVGTTFNGSALPRIDSLEVYGRPKDEFGWKEKMDAVLDMESRVLGSNSWAITSRKKIRSMQSAPPEEEVLADGLKLLSRLYLLCKPQGCSKVEDMKPELSVLKCKQLLETIFESDGEPLLQSSACRILQAAYPKREIYYQVKDSMRLLGVVKSAALILSRLGVGGSTSAWIIEEFTAQMHAVSKIALHRRSNLAAFLEMNGSQVVDGLMQVLWGILEIEQPDTQTMNNIVISSVELIYCYAECLALHGKEAGGHSVAAAVVLLKKLLFSPNEAVQTASSLAISSRLLQVPFPKQTMLATDDAADNATSASAHVDTVTASGGNAQVMMEEETVTSSVQYCCDGCSTVPILRRRWHCTVCPDFDLCEACYEVVDADRLPPPHSRDHLMTAIPIEVENLGGEGTEIHFPSGELSVSGILPTSSNSNVQNSTPSIHVLEPNELEDFSPSVLDPISISESKRAVNSLLLSELLDQLRGWMLTTSGVRAIPVMQLFYRLSSAVGGPFIHSSNPESLDLEKLIKWFLDEINLKKPFVARSRSSCGEVTILVCMFFTLMLRNWHQPGSDGSVPKSGGSSDTLDRSYIQNPLSASFAAAVSSDNQDKNDFTMQLLRACNVLRQQSFVNYLMDILQQLVHVFKSTAGNLESSSSSHHGSGCGALLSVRRELPAGNFSPFFSDSYAKAHRVDIFADYHRLLLENTFRLVYSLVRPEKHEKSGEKEKVYKLSSSKDLKLEGYQDVLCSYINNPHTTFVRRYARRLFLHLCGSKSHYYSVRDSWQFSSEIKRLHKHVNKTGGFQNPVPYERSVKIIKCLCTMAEVAAARPRNWQKYCLRHAEVLPLLLKWIFYLGEESVIQTLKLLNLAFYTGKDMNHSSQKVESGDAAVGSNKSASQSQDTKKKKKGDDGTESGSEKSCLDMEVAVDIFTDKDGEVLRQFIDCFLLEWNSSAVRAEAKCVLHGIWQHGKQLFKENMLRVLFEKVKCLPMYGPNIAEYTELQTWLLGKVPDVSSKQLNAELLDKCLTSDVIQCFYETLHMQNELLANHPNSRIYNTLSGLVEFDGYYLESEPCVSCSSPEVPYSRMKLESLKSETKFTDNRIIVKCTGSYTIQSVTMNVHDARKSKSVKVLNLYYNNRPVTDLSELKNNWSLWKRAKSCHLASNQTELKVDFPIPITACNFMIELDSFYENLQASSMEPLQCPRCSRPVTDRHGICSNCHENAYQCRQCRNINYENLDSFLCNECGYSKYGRFEFNFMAKPSFTFDNMENDEDMKRGLAAIESESENAHRRYQQLLGFKKPLLKIVSSIGENDIDSQQKDSVQQMMVSLPGPSCKINRKIALLGVLYGEKCKAAFDSVSKSVQTLQGLRRVLMNYLHQKHCAQTTEPSRFVVSRTPSSCYGCATTFVVQCLEILQVLSKHPNSKRQLVASGILTELFENNIHQGPKSARSQARAVLCAFSEGDMNAVNQLNNLIQKKVLYCLEHHRSMDIAVATREEMLLLSEICSSTDEFWESRLRVVFQLLFTSIKVGSNHPAISEHVILPCLRIISQACTPPKADMLDKESSGKSQPSKDASNSDVTGTLGVPANVSSSTSELVERNWNGSQKTQDIHLLSYSEWEKGASYLDFVRRQGKVSQAFRGPGHKSRPQRYDFLALKYGLRWKRRACARNNFASFELGSWVSGLILSACSQSIRSEMCMLVNLLCAQSSSRRFRLLNLLMAWLPLTLSAAENAVEYFDLLFKMIEMEDARLFLTAGGCLSTICKLITQEVNNIESLERSLHIDISQGFILHKLIELLGKFLEIPNIRARFMRDDLLSEVLEALIVIRGLVVQKTKLISDCNRLLKDLLDSLLQESSENKRLFIRACICGLQIHGDEKKGQISLFILEQLCNLICPSKPESVYFLILNKAHTQEEFIRGNMTKNPYSSAEVGPLMRDVKNKICHQLDMLGLIEDDYGMELLVAGNIISLDLSVAQVYEQVWKKANIQSSNTVANATMLTAGGTASTRDCPPMIVTYRLQGLDGEATEPMIKELDEDREESQDPEVEFAIAGAVREYGGMEIILGMIKRLRDDLKSNHEQLIVVLNLLMYCCKIRENRRALLRLGALSLLLETARRAFSVDAMEAAEGILLIVEALTLEANESDNINITQSGLTITSEETGAGEQAKKIVLMFLERLSHTSGLKKSSKQQRNTEMVARILPYLTYGEPSAMEALVQHFDPYLQNWTEFDRLQTQHEDDPKDDGIAQRAVNQRFAVENFVRVSESLKTSSCGERLKDIILEKGITGVAVGHLREIFAVAGHPGYKSMAEWTLGLKLPSVPLILSMLRGLSMGHLPTQNCINEGGILPLLHALEGVSGENEIGARAENLLDTLSDKEGNGDGFLGEKILNLRHATRDEMRRRALRKREELLQGLGMRQELSSDGGERIVVSRPNLEGFEDVEEEEDGLACMVCREGYSLRPNDLLGVYSYSKRVNLGAGTSGSARGECVYTTVSHFNIIHFQCHQEAKRADAALKNPKKEWEGATLRNNETLCNALFPIRGPAVPLGQYVRYVDQYWDNLNALGRADGSRLRLLMYDIVLMLARFATGASFSSDSKGGGKESNSKFLPFMIQMARHLLDQGSGSQRRSMARAISSYLTSSSDSRPSPSSPLQPSGGTEETVQFMMVSSLLTESYEFWLQHRRAFIQRGIYHAYMQHAHSKSLPRGSSSTRSEQVTSGSDDLLPIIQPMLVYTGLIEQLQQFFKPKQSTVGASTDGEGTSKEGEGDDENGLESWEVVMKDKVLDMKEMVGFSKELLSWLDDMTSAGDLQEAFDVIGALADVLSGENKSCEEFVQAAINAGKN
ncbi:auxin transport protein BIG [Beta vulgaris subsp. vulgaris]|uniref:auxin transport protein BIG n=1 Tax=Beta vulgaris subsp. vulgaris TaxID=3555 RepID=UPI00203680EF|nr:auxin transport protein BIG [Beta vulgaris subsp. vulgaris]